MGVLSFSRNIYIILLLILLFCDVTAKHPATARSPSLVDVTAVHTVTDTALRNRLRPVPNRQWHTINRILSRYVPMSPLKLSRWNMTSVITARRISLRLIVATSDTDWPPLPPPRRCYHLWRIYTRRSSRRSVGAIIVWF